MPLSRCLPKYPSSSSTFPSLSENQRSEPTNLRDTLLVVPAEQDRPGDPAGVLALEEKRLGFAILEAEDLAVATDEQLTLKRHQPVSQILFPALSASHRCVR
jgi:hypothetical protein